MEQTTFRTKDLGEAAVLLCHQIELIEVVTNKGKCWFAFSPFDAANDLISKYWQHQLTVDPQDFFHATNRLKQVIVERKYEKN